MMARKHLLKASMALTLALGASAPTAASAMLPPPDPPQQANHGYVLNTPHDVGITTRPSVQLVQAPADHGFDWGDAGIGAAAGLGLSMLAAGGLAAAQRRTRHAQ